MEVFRLLIRRETGGMGPPFHHAPVAVNEFHFGEAEQILRVVRILGGAPRGHLPILPEESGQPELLKGIFQ